MTVKNIIQDEIVFMAQLVSTAGLDEDNKDYLNRELRLLLAKYATEREKFLDEAKTQLSPIMK